MQVNRKNPRASAQVSQAVIRKLHPAIIQLVTEREGEVYLGVRWPRAFHWISLGEVESQMPADQLVRYCLPGVRI